MLSVATDSFPTFYRNQTSVNILVLQTKNTGHEASVSTYVILLGIYCEEANGL